MIKFVNRDKVDLESILENVLKNTDQLKALSKELGTDEKKGNK